MTEIMFALFLPLIIGFAFFWTIYEVSVFFLAIVSSFREAMRSPGDVT